MFIVFKISCEISNTVFLETISLFGYILEFIKYSNRELYMNI